MGTDIHHRFDKKIGNNYVEIESDYKGNRHYRLFAWLANVRNGFGFAGVKTGEPIKPIIEPNRGIPKDLEKYNEGYYNTLWLGDHSFSWLTSTEILLEYNKLGDVITYGVITRGQYNEWDKETSPFVYSGECWGPKVKVIEENEVSACDDWTHIRVSWNTGLKAEFDYFIKEIQDLVKEHGEIRMVFGFDS